MAARRERTDVQLVAVAGRNAVGGVKNVVFFWMWKEKSDEAESLACDVLSWGAEFSEPRCRDGLAAIVVTHGGMNAVVITAESSHYDKASLVRCGEEAIENIKEYPHADKRTIGAMILSSAQQLVPVACEPPPKEQALAVGAFRWKMSKMVIVVVGMLLPCIGIPMLFLFF